MKYFYLFLFVFLIQEIQYAQNSSSINHDIQIGIYGLQSPPGSNGFQTGSLKDVESDIKSVVGTFNASIPYRHWDRVNYPKWDFNSYVLTYLENMYSLSFNPDDFSCIQSFTPPLYSSFLDPPIARMPDDDKNYNRSLNFDLFQNFVKKVLEKELILINNVANGDKDKFVKIITNPKLRPLGGWYLDDEPLVRNHDIEVVETMSELIRLIEKEFFYERIVPLGVDSILMEKYLHPRYIAFDGDDLHKYSKSGRSFDGKFYNRNGNSIYFKSNQIYTVFKENTFDVLLLDFYHNDIPFWEKMLNEIPSEFKSVKQKMPKVMLVASAQVESASKINEKIEELNRTIQLISEYKLQGIWMYIWDDNDSKNLDAKIIWNDSQQKLKIDLKSMER